MWNSGKTAIENAFGGSVKIFYTSAFSYNSFYIIISSIPEEACIELATFDWSVLSNKVDVGLGFNMMSYIGQLGGCREKRGIVGIWGCTGDTTAPIPFRLDEVISAGQCRSGEITIVVD